MPRHHISCLRVLFISGVLIMADTTIKTELGAKAAMGQDIDIKGTVWIEAHMTRRFIWMMKLRYIWAVIRARVGE